MQIYKAVQRNLTETEESTDIEHGDAKPVSL